MAEKILKTRIQLRYDTLTNWTTNNPVLKAGEIAIATIPTAAPANKQLPPVMFKVGDGASKFTELDWASALAADVYNWAKESGLPVEYSGSGKVVTNIEWKVTGTHPNGALVITKGNLTASDVGVNETTFPGLKKVGTVTGVKMNSGAAKTPDANGVVDLGTVITAHQDISGKQDKIKAGTHISIGTDGVTINAAWPTDSDTGYAGIDKTGTVTGINMNGVSKGTSGVVDLGTVITAHQTVELASGTNNGTLKLTVGETTTDNIAVKGLGTAAYTASNAYATAAQGTKAENALPKTEFDTFKTSNTKAIADAKAAGTTAQESLNSYKTTNDAAVGKNATDIANLQTAVKAGITFKGKVDTLPAVTNYENGDLIIVGTKEYILSDNAGIKTWIELGDEGSHLTKATADGYYVAKNASITGATKCKITYDSKGLVTKGEDLKATDIPDLSASKITSGTFADNRIASASTWNAKQNALSVDQLNAVNSGITADKVGAYDGYATTIAGKQNALSTTQLDAVNSGITGALVTKYNGYETSKQDKITSSNKLAASLVSGLATVATSGSYNDLTNKPSIPSAAKDAALKDTSGQVIFTANASEDVTITVIDCGNSSSNW